VEVESLEIAVVSSLVVKGEQKVQLGTSWLWEKPSLERWTEMVRQLPQGSNHLVTPNHLEFIFCLAVH